jgi:protein-S-isoprenylcysteine O-methyltransferase Ste14
MRVATTDDIALAERLTRRRARMVTVFALFFLLSMITSLDTDVPVSRPETFKLAAWLVWAAALLFLLATGGGLLRTAAVRQLLNDESTSENRRSAMVAGFWATVLSAFALYVISLFEPVTGREAIRLLLSAAVVAALLKFGSLERRSLRD